MTAKNKKNMAAGPGESSLADEDVARSHVRRHGDAARAVELAIINGNSAQDGSKSDWEQPEA